MTNWTGVDELLPGGSLDLSGALRNTERAPAVEKHLGAVKVARGFEEMYRSFSRTPGNTLSLQACPWVVICVLLQTLDYYLG